MDAPGRYDHLSRDQAIELLERRDGQRTYGLVWERDGIEGDRALNDDFVALDLVPELSTPPLDGRGWRNLVVEGDNWDALRALRLAYAGRVKCILIDPPYNTGNKDFTYNDRFVGAQDRYRQSTWLEFLYRRLLLARDLLAEDGVILACINDENRARLDLLMERVFPGMRVGSFVWKTRSGSNDAGGHGLSVDHEHILVFGSGAFSFGGVAKDTRAYKNPDDDPRGAWKTGDLTKGHSYKERPNAYYPVQNPDTGIWYPCNPTRVWAFASEQRLTPAQKLRQPTMEEWIRRKKIVWPDPASERVVTWPTREALLAAIDVGDVPKLNRGRTPLLRSDLPDLEFWIGKPVSFERPWFRRHLSDLRSRTSLVSSWIRGATEKGEDSSGIVTQRSGTSEDSVKEILGYQAFSFPKPPSLFKGLVRAATGEDDIILDFFAGSGTTGHAALAINAEDEGDRRFILVSNSEATTDDPEKNLCRDVCAERVRRVISGYSGVAGLAGDFAYLRARRIPVEDTTYDLDPAAIWALVQLRHGRPLLPYDPLAAVQVSPPGDGEGDSATLLFVADPVPAAMERARELARQGDVVVFTPVPGPLRDALGTPALPVEQVPGRLLAEFPRVLAGL